MYIKSVCGGVCLEGIKPVVFLAFEKVSIGLQECLEGIKPAVSMAFEKASMGLHS